ncbi:hypothetical protein [Burkholderia sp. Ac-20353]|uniref:hypothetical protein n=1 Tax=Burkholderia sp. Ac-20353 TaxID=2703894 RepID=UPI00197C4B99|nr:hypothetical protein [Burkholderia sp. Ac-20353]
MLELIGWIRDGSIMDKVTSPIFWLTFGAFCVAGYYLGCALSDYKATAEEE